MIEIASLTLGDTESAWKDLGFEVGGGGSWVSGVMHVCDPSVGKGIRRWSLRDAGGGDGAALAPDFEGIPTALDDAGAAPAPDGAHPNGVVGLDHVVLLTPDIARTVSCLEASGVECRRVRDTDTYGAPMRQAFFRFGPVILEVIGGAEPTGSGPARFFGLAWTVRDLDETAEFLGDRLHPAKDAVQPGRRIATLDKVRGGSTVAMAFMSAGPTAVD